MNDNGQALEKRHPIQVAARRAGLTPHVLRAWEKRYGRAVAPSRGPGGRRLYADADIARLRLLRMATGAGRRIGDIAHLSTKRLQTLVEEDSANQLGAPTTLASTASAPQRPVLDAALTAIRDFDALSLERLLGRAQVRLPSDVFLDAVLAPLLTELGEMWAAGVISPGQEHAATATIRNALTGMANRLAPPGDSPALIVSTPRGERHDLGAGLVAAAAAAEGWRAIYLGSDLPPEEIADAARRLDAILVAVSLVFPGADPDVATQLVALRAALPPRVELVAGGRAAHTYAATLERIEATLLPDLVGFRAVLRSVAAAHAVGTDFVGDSA